MNTTSGLRTRGDTETDGRAAGQGDRQTDRARMAEGQTGCWQRTERDRRGADKTKAQDTHPATHCSSSHKEREMEREREGEWEKDKDCARSRPPHGCCPVSNCISCFISLSRGNRHCLLLYGRAKRREQGKEGGRRRGNCAGNAMLESVLTRRSLRHFIKSGHGAVQFSTHFLCTASRATSFPSFRYFLSSFPRYLVRHLSSVSLLSLSKSIVLLLSKCHPQLAKVLSSGTYNFWHLGINFSSYRGMNRQARGSHLFQDDH